MTEVLIGDLLPHSHPPCQQLGGNKYSWANVNYIVMGHMAEFRNALKRFVV